MKPAFTLLSAVTAPGSKVNEDAYGLWPVPNSAQAAWVLDGVTGINDRVLLPGPSDAAWFVGQVQEALPALLSEQPDRPIADLVGALVRELERRQSTSWLGTHGADGRETPAASFALLRSMGEELEIARLGDCLVLVERKDGSVITLEHPVLEAMEAKTRAAILEFRAGGISDPAEVLRRMTPTLRVQRASRNRPDSYGVLAAEQACVAMLHVDRLPLNGTNRVLLASDGYYRLVDHYSMVTDADLVRRTAEQGAGRLLAELRAIEAGDPTGAAYPRLKMSDDATALLLKVA